MVTMRDVAAAAGVSPMTVSNALTGRRPVSDDARRRVLEAVDELGYQVNVAARSLRQGRTGIVGLAVPVLQSHYFGLLASLFVRRMTEEGLRVVVEETGGVRAGEIAALRGSRLNAYDGLVLSSVGLRDGEVDAVRGDLPVVVLGEEPFGHRVDHVSMANVAASADATRLLLRRGARRLALVGAPPLDEVDRPAPGSIRTFVQRSRGFLAAAGEVEGVSVTSVDHGSTAAGGARAVEELLARGTPVDGLVCVTDTIALGALRALADRGVRVPDDVLVVGFDDVEEARFSVPRLSSVAPGHEEMVDAAVRLLLRRMADRGAEPELFVGPAHVVERESTGG